MNRIVKTILMSGIVIFTALGGNQYWKRQKTMRSEKASIIYEELLASQQAQQYDKVKSQADLLVREYAETPYATLGSMFMARLDVEHADFKSAATRLEYASTHGYSTVLKHIAQVRLARIRAAQGDFAQALKLLEYAGKDSYIALYAEARGDVYVLTQDLDKAREAYALAVRSAPPEIEMPWLQLKHSDLMKEEG